LSDSVHRCPTCYDEASACWVGEREPSGHATAITWECPQKHRWTTGRSYGQVKAIREERELKAAKRRAAGERRGRPRKHVHVSEKIARLAQL
jgi:hypothetical protein